MTRRVPVLTLAWYLCLVAILGMRRNPQLRLGQPPTVPPVEAPTALAVDVLSRATALKSAAIGIAGSPPIEVLAWRILVEAPASDSLFLQVYAQSRNDAGKLWALAGLRVVAAAEFERQAAPLEVSGREVETVVGCVLGTRPVGEVIRELRRFDWVREYFRGPRAAAEPANAADKRRRWAPSASDPPNGEEGP